MKKNLKDLGYGLLPGSAILQGKKIRKLKEKNRELDNHLNNFEAYSNIKKELEERMECESSLNMKQHIFSDSALALIGLGGLDAICNEIHFMSAFFLGSYVLGKEVVNHKNKNSIENLKGMIETKKEILDSYTQDYCKFVKNSK